jgi:hypothetical protein
MRTLDQLGESVLDEIGHSFASYNEIRGREFEPPARAGPERAETLVRDGMDRVAE